VLHSAPLAMPSCSEPLPASSSLRFGGRGGGTISIAGIGSPREAALRWTVNIKDVRNAAGLPYTGGMAFLTTTRVTHQNCRQTVGGVTSLVTCTRPDEFTGILFTCADGVCKANYKTPPDLPQTRSIVQIGVGGSGPGQDNCLYEATGPLQNQIAGKFACAGVHVL
jgi:hypothetical protein